VYSLSSVDSTHTIVCYDVLAQAGLCKLRTRINPINFVRIGARDPPLMGNNIGKIPNFQSFGGSKSTP